MSVETDAQETRVSPPRRHRNNNEISKGMGHLFLVCTNCTHIGYIAEVTWNAKSDTRPLLYQWTQSNLHDRALWFCLSKKDCCKTLVTDFLCLTFLFCLQAIHYIFKNRYWRYQSCCICTFIFHTHTCVLC